MDLQKSSDSAINNRQATILAIALYAMYWFVLPKQMHADRNFWVDWTQHLYQAGLRHAYSGNTDYLPLYQYVLWIYVKLQGSVENIVSNIYILKGFALTMDFLGAAAVVYLVKESSRRWFYFFLLVMNPIFIYNSYLWGQVDAYHSFLLMISCIGAYRGKWLLTFIFYLLAINFKLQSIVYLPVIALLLFPHLKTKGSFRNILLSTSVVLVIQCMIIYPFWSVGELDKMINVIFNSVDHYPNLSLNAFNMWYWWVDTNPEATLDSITFSGITAKNWGFIFFCSASFILLFPLLMRQWNIFFKGINYQEEDQTDIMLLCGALVTLNFFFFCTQMHERYCHVAMLFVCAFSFRQKKWWILGLFFITYFLNNEKIMCYLSWTNYNTLIFQPRLIAVLWAILMLMLYQNYFLRIFRKSISKNQSL